MTKLKSKIPGKPLHEGVGAMLSKTHMGMAHIAGSGPSGTTCRICTKFQLPKVAHKANGVLKDGKCAKYHAMMRRTGKAFPGSVRSCRYFEENDNPPVAILS